MYIFNEHVLIGQLTKSELVIMFYLSKINGDPTESYGIGLGFVNPGVKDIEFAHDIEGI